MTQPPSEKPIPLSRAETAGLAAIGRTLDDQRKALKVAEDRAHNEGLPNFVTRSRQLGAALIEVAEQQVTRANNNLSEVKTWVENMEAEAQRKWEEMQDLERKFEDYRSYLLQANDRFNGGKK